MAWNYQLPTWTPVRISHETKRRILARADTVRKSQLGSYVVATWDSPLGEISYRLDYAAYDPASGTYAIGQAYRLEYKAQ